MSVWCARGEWDFVLSERMKISVFLVAVSFLSFLRGGGVSQKGSTSAFQITKTCDLSV